jgi:hypothetical protein
VSGQRRRAAAEVHALEVRREQVSLELELGEERVDVRAVEVVVPDDGDEVAVAAARGAEREMDVEVSDAVPHVSAWRRRSG